MDGLGFYMRRVLILAGIAGLMCALALAEAAPASTKATQKSSTAAKPKGPTTKATSAHSRTSSRTSRKGKRSKRVRGQQKIDGERTHQIQEALIRQHYLSGEPTGKWDASTEEALRRFQADNGWQNKTVPDSRALIKLGLGPSHDHLLNPESAMTTAPQAPQPAATTVPVPAANGSANQPQR